MTDNPLLQKYEEWYKMNNKMYAYTGCVETYEEPRDFEDIYETI